jgi:hypothetical protein
MLGIGAQHHANHVPEYGGCHGNFAAYEASIRREFRLRLPLQLNLPYSTEESRISDLQLLSKPRTF